VVGGTWAEKQNEANMACVFSAALGSSKRFGQQWTLLACFVLSDITCTRLRPAGAETGSLKMRKLLRRGQIEKLDPCDWRFAASIYYRPVDLRRSFSVATPASPVSRKNHVEGSGVVP